MGTRPKVDHHQHPLQSNEAREDECDDGGQGPHQLCNYNPRTLRHLAVRNETGSLLVGALLIGASSMSSAAEVHIDEPTLCLEALRAFDEKDLPTIEEFLRFVQGVFDELNAVPESGRNCAHSKTDCQEH